MATFLTDKAPFFVNDPATASAVTLQVGYTEIEASSTAATCSYTLPVPYAGAFVSVFQTVANTSIKKVHTSSTGITINKQGDQAVSLNGEGDSVQLLGKSSTRWVLVGVSGTPVFGT